MYCRYLKCVASRCWDKDASVRPTIGEVVTETEFIQDFFPCVDDDPLDFPPEGQSTHSLSLPFSKNYNKVSLFRYVIGQQGYKPGGRQELQLRHDVCADGTDKRGT